MMKLLTSAIVCFAFIGGVIGQSLAASGPWQGNAQFQARLISAIKSLDGRATITAGLEVKLAKGWKTYWRSPGDAGLPPVLDFSQTPSVLDHHLDYPAPKRFSILGFDSFGYAEHVIYPLQLSISPSQRGITIAAQFDGLVCKDVCIPLREVLTLTLPKGSAAPSEHAQSIAQFMAKVPRQSTTGGIVLDAVYLDGDNLIVTFQHSDDAVIPVQADIMPDDIIIEAKSGYAFAPPSWKRLGQGSGQGSGQMYQARIAISGKPAQDLLSEPITVTAVAQDWLLEQPAIITAYNGAHTTPKTSFEASPSTDIQGGLNTAGKTVSGLIGMMAIAFLGGLILNIMPCVLPVISLKLGAVMGKGDSPKQAVRLSFLVTAAGVITSFLALGGVLLMMRQAGIAIGWGIQFQNPVFLGLAASAIAIFGLILLDVIHLPVPQFAQRLSQSSNRAQNGAQNGGQNNATPQGLIGDFMSGALATLLATPCSAPFVGTAVAFALTADPMAMMVMFLAMGVGLATPWLVIAIFPSMAAMLPKPGAWFKTLKRILAAGLFVTAAWLVSILVTVTMGASSDGDGWQVWRPNLAEDYAQNGQIVFVDVTADWCLTCKANKALVLNTDDIQSAFASDQVVLLQADWTTPNDQITSYLASFDRYGIPFNIVYGPAAPQGLILPELLTKELVMNAIKNAK